MACKIVNVQSPMSGSFVCKWFAFEHMSIMIHCLELWVVSNVGWNLGVPVMSWSCQSMWSLIQFPACALLGQSCGSFATIISSSRRVPLQKAFLQVPCFSFWPSSTAMDANSLAADQLKTGTQWSSRDYTLFSKFLRSTTLDFALIGFPFWFGFIANRFIVGIKQALFPCFFGWFLHFSVLISVKTFNPSDPSYSLLHAASHALWSILVRADVMRKLGGAKLWHDIAATNQMCFIKYPSNVKGVLFFAHFSGALHVFDVCCFDCLPFVVSCCEFPKIIFGNQWMSMLMICSVWIKDCDLLVLFWPNWFWEIKTFREDLLQFCFNYFVWILKFDCMKCWMNGWWYHCKSGKNVMSLLALGVHDITNTKFCWTFYIVRFEFSNKPPSQSTTGKALSSCFLVSKTQSAKAQKLSISGSQKITSPLVNSLPPRAIPSMDWASNLFWEALPFQTQQSVPTAPNSKSMQQSGFIPQNSLQAADQWAGFLASLWFCAIGRRSC